MSTIDSDESDDGGDESIMLQFTVVGDKVRIERWPRRRPVQACRVCLIPRDIDFFNVTTQSGDKTFARTLHKRYRGAMTLPIQTIVRLKRGQLSLNEITTYERIT